MAITREQLAALSPIADLKKRESTEVDLAKVATTLVDEIDATLVAEDPDAAVGALEKRLDEIGGMLDMATELEDGTVVVSAAPGESEIAKEFKADEAEDADKAKGKGMGKKPPFGKEDMEDEESAKGKTKKDGEGEDGEGEESDDADAEAGKKDGEGEESDGEDGEGEETDTEKSLSDDIEWERDLAPAKPPIRRAERLTKGEVPVPARKGARQHVADKYTRARDRAMGRGKRATS